MGLDGKKSHTQTAAPCSQGLYKEKHPNHYLRLCSVETVKSLLCDFNCVIIKLDSLLNWAAAQSDKARSIELIP